ncbi:MAG: Arginine decarboxylase [Clostridia bacterium 62_21]|nr:MAG: Arginine decarboxylase [Clostridia bacterium 62_21]
MRRLARGLLTRDLTELPGLDDLHRPHGPIAAAQRLAAELFGAAATFFLVNGSTVGLQALLLGLLQPGDRVLLPRHVHRAVVGGLVLAGAEPVFVEDEPVPGFDVPAGPPVARVARELAAAKPKAVLVLHPNYYGITGEIGPLAALVHAAGGVLWADEAHGAHLPFHGSFPPPALKEGADASVQSLHKLGGALTQAALLHLRGTGETYRRVASALRLLQTSSPSYLLLFSLDLVRRELALRGRDMFARAAARAHEARAALRRIPGIDVLELEHLPPGRGLDPLKVVVNWRETGLSGYAAAARLRRLGVQVEMADAANTVAVVGPGTPAAAVRRFVRSVREVARRAPGKRLTALLPGLPRVPRAMAPRDAWLAGRETVPLERAAGRVAAETVAVTPPGTPVLVPGEQITHEVVAYLLEARSRGWPVAGLNEDGAVQVVRE